MITTHYVRFWKQWNFINMHPFRMLNKAGEYVGTMTEGDILWGIKKYTNLNLKEAETIFIQDFQEKQIMRLYRQMLIWRIFFRKQ